MKKFQTNNRIPQMSIMKNTPIVLARYVFCTTVHIYAKSATMMMSLQLTNPSLRLHQHQFPCFWEKYQVGPLQ